MIWLAAAPEARATTGRLFLDRRVRPFDRVPATRVRRRGPTSALGRGRGTHRRGRPAGLMRRSAAAGRGSGRGVAGRTRRGGAGSGPQGVSGRSAVGRRSLQAVGEVVVEVVPAELVAEPVELGRLVDEHELERRHRREVGEVLGRDPEPEARVVRAARVDPGRGVGLEVRAGSPQGTRDGQPRQRLRSGRRRRRRSRPSGSAGPCR